MIWYLMMIDKVDWSCQFIDIIFIGNLNGCLWNIIHDAINMLLGEPSYIGCSIHTIIENCDVFRWVPMQTQVFHGCITKLDFIPLTSSSIKKNVHINQPILNL